MAKYPLLSSARQLKKAVRQQESELRNALGEQYSVLLSISAQFSSGKDTLHKYSKDGVFSPERERVHQRILDKSFKGKRSVDKKDPDLYILGGVAGSGKTSTLRGIVNEPVVIIDPDAYKGDLSHFDKSPIPKYPLAHAALLHEESSHIQGEAIDRSIKERRNVILDTTLANREKNLAIINRYKAAGYDVHLLGTQLAPHQSIPRTTKRFLTSKEGRYVPASIVASKGNTINQNVWSVAHNRSEVDTAIVADTSTFPARIVLRRGNMKRNFRNPPE